MKDFSAHRTMMVDTQVRPSDVTKFPIIDAMLNVPREQFVPVQHRDTAYVGENIDLGDGRVLLEPRTLAKILDGLDLAPNELVLDVGSALGYSSAVIAHMAQAVVAVESVDAWSEEASSALMEAGIDNVITHVAQLSEGAAEHGPYDAIVLQGGVEHIPAGLLDQLKDGGRIAALFVENAVGEVRIGYKRDGLVSWRRIFNAGAPILPGFKSDRLFEL